MDAVTLSDVRDAHRRISPHIHRTPVLRCATLDDLAGCELHFKSESYQKTGAFKVRGALNAVLSLKERRGDEVTGVATHSSGNHGQAVAYACRVAGLPCTVVLPEGTPSANVSAVRGYGAEVIFCKPCPVSRQETCEQVATEKGWVIVHPFDDLDVIAGQGTVGLELIEDVPDLDAIIVPVCGGGLAAGVGTVAKGLRPECKVYIAEPFGKELQPCLESGRRLWPEPPRPVDTIAEGLAIQPVGRLNFPIILGRCESKVFTVTDDEMVAAMRLLWERCKVVTEVSGTAAVAAALSPAIKTLGVRKVGVVVSGGNANVNNLPWNH